MRKVLLTRMGNALFIRPWIDDDPLFEELADELTCERTVRTPMGHYKAYVHALYDVAEADTGHSSCLTYGGFYKRVCDVLRRDKSVMIKVKDRQDPLPEPDWSHIPPLRKRQPEAIAAITSAQRGMIVSPTAFGKSFVIQVLCLLYPQQNILVVSKMGRVVQQLYRKLAEALGEDKVARAFGRKPRWPDSARAVVTTTKSLYKIPFDWPQMLLFDEAHNAAATDVSTVLTNFIKPRMFGFTATPQGRGDGTDLLTEAFFGDRICDISYQEAVKDGTVSQIHALLIKADLSEIDTTDLTTMDKNKYGYWWNGPRNRMLLAAAEEYLKPDEAALYYVENTEHALYLRLLVPGLVIAHGGISAKRWKFFLKKGLVQPEDAATLKNPNLDKLEKDFLEGRIKRIACTTTWKEGVDFPDLAGLVRFDGGAGEIPSEQIAGRLSRIGSDGQKIAALLIDAYDKFGSRYQDRSVSRIRVYKKNGWRITELWKR